MISSARQSRYETPIATQAFGHAKGTRYGLSGLPDCVNHVDAFNIKLTPPLHSRRLLSNFHRVNAAEITR